MKTSLHSLIEVVKTKTKETGVLPCIKLKARNDFIAYAGAMYDGGARVIEVTMTTPGALEAIEAISSEFSGKLWVAAGTVLDPISARQVILHGGSLIVNPCVIPDVIDMALRYQVPVYSGAFSATECFQAMRLGSTMVKVFPAKLGGPGYMTNLKMVFPNIDLIPSGGINLENAAAYIQSGASAVSGARTFMDRNQIEKHGLSWITEQVRRFIDIVADARRDMSELP